VRLEDGGDAAVGGEPAGQAGLGAVQVQQVGADRTDQPGGAAHLAGQVRARRAARRPRPDLRAALRRRGPEHAAGRTGDDDPRPLPHLRTYQVRDDAGDAGLHRLRHMEHRQPVELVLVLRHRAPFSLSGHLKKPECGQPGGPAINGDRHGASC